MSNHDPETQKLARPGAHPLHGTEESSVLVVLPLLFVIAGTIAWYAMNEHASPSVASASHEEATPHVDAAVEPEPELAPAPEPAAPPATPAPAKTRRAEPKVARAKAPSDLPETRAEAREADPGTPEIRAEPAPPPAPAMSEEIAVKHKHRMGSCEGVLRVSAETLAYESSHKDAFSVALSQVERFSREKETLSVRVRDGRTYNFAERNEDQAALVIFHERVSPALAKN